jgi:hypothetical protein
VDVIDPEADMQPTRSSGPGLATRRIWQAPAVTKLAIGVETKSTGHTKFTQPQPPAAPDMKLGFSFEWSIPLSARIEK